MRHRSSFLFRPRKALLSEPITTHLSQFSYWWLKLCTAEVYVLLVSKIDGLRSEDVLCEKEMCYPSMPSRRKCAHE